jgi:hypothetical protein
VSRAGALRVRLLAPDGRSGSVADSDPVTFTQPGTYY